MTGGGVSEVFRVLDLSGVFANALLGGAIAREEKLDPIGFITLAVFSGLGGGAIRDVMLQHGPPAALIDHWYLGVALVGALVSYVANVQGRTWDALWPILDAIALGCWASAGAQKTLGLGLGWLPAVVLGITTAVGGGAVRDVILRRIPGVLGGNTLYATAAAAAAGVLVIMTHMGMADAGLIAGSIVGAALCLAARHRGWILPNADAWSPRSVVPSRRQIRRLRPSVLVSRSGKSVEEGAQKHSGATRFEADGDE